MSDHCNPCYAMYACFNILPTERNCQVVPNEMQTYQTAVLWNLTYQPPSCMQAPAKGPSLRDLAPPVAHLLVSAPSPPVSPAATARG